MQDSDILPGIQSDLDQLEKNKYQIKKKAAENFIQQKLTEKKLKAAANSKSPVAKQEPQPIELADSEIDFFLKARNLDRKKMSPLDMNNVINNLKLQKQLQADKIANSKLLQESNIRYKIPLPDEAQVKLAAGQFPWLGSSKANVEIIMISNFNCPRCSDAEKKMALIKEKYKDQVKFSYRFLMSEPDQSSTRVLAEAAYCADDQKKFWAFHDQLILESESPSAENRLKNVEKIGLDVKQFENCSKTRRHKADLDKDMLALSKIPSLQPPSFIINGRLQSANESIEDIFLVIDQDL